MLFRKNHCILLIIFFAVVSCNIVPLHKTKITKTLLNNKVTVEEIDTEIGFYINQNLRFSLKDNGTKKDIRLTNELEITKREYGLSSSNQTTRIEVLGKLTGLIKKNKDSHTFNINEKVSYDVNQSNVANKAAEQNAKKRLANLLSQAVLMELYHLDHDWLE